MATPLHLAARFAKLSTAKLLVQAGSRAMVLMDKAGHKPVDVARNNPANKKKNEISSFLMDAEIDME